MSVLKSDHLEIIFEILYDDKKSLNSCLYVNKLWCSTLVELLWRDPWTYFLKEDRLNEAKSFFKTILSQLPDDSRKFLIKESKVNLEPQRKPFLFDYISFIKYIRHTYSADGKKDNDIYEYVFKDYGEPQRIDLKKEIYKCFIRKC